MTENLHRLLALALLITVGSGAHWVFKNVWQERHQYYQSNLEQAEDRLQRFERLAATEPALRERLSAVGQNSNADAYYLSQTAPNLAATELQQQVKSLVESHGGRLASSQILPVSNENGFTRVSIRVQLLVTDLSSLQKALHALESAEPLLFVDQVQMRAREVRKRVPVSRNRAQSRAERRAQRQQRRQRAVKTETQLTAQFELSGFIAKQSQSG